MKKIFLCGTVLVLSLFAVGCEKTIELTEEENKLIAEYSSELLLKYDKNFTSKYFGSAEFKSPHTIWDDFASATDATTEEATTEDMSKPDEDKKPATTEKPDTAASPTDPLATPTNPPSNVGNGMEDVSGTEIKADYKHSDFDLAQFVDLGNASIKYQYSVITDEHPSYDSSGMYIGVQAPKGYKLLVLKFRIENKTNDKQKINLYEKDIQYKIIIDNKKSAKQMFTILMDDLYTYNAMVGESGISDAVLLFQISDSVADSSKDMKLQIEYQDKKAIVQLQ